MRSATAATRFWWSSPVDTNAQALVSPDVAVDSRGRAYVEEINTNGMIMGTHQPVWKSTSA